jgi:hypothetical protein
MWIFSTAISYNVVRKNKFEPTIMKKGILSFVLMLLSFTLIAHGNSLTPKNHPRNNSFYVCYKHIRNVQRNYRLFYHYDRYRYIGCIISKTQCNYRHNHRAHFGWYKTYFQAKNAFYRCAYSG